MTTGRLPLPEVESRTQGSRPRPRTQKNSEAKAKDPLEATDLGHRRNCSPNKKGLQKFFSGDFKKKRSSKIFFRQKRSSKFFFSIFSASSIFFSIPVFNRHMTTGRLSLPEVESRTQGSRPRPRTQKNSVAKAKDKSSRG